MKSSSSFSVHILLILIFFFFFFGSTASSLLLHHCEMHLYFFQRKHIRVIYHFFASHKLLSTLLAWFSLGAPDLDHWNTNTSGKITTL